MLSEHSSDPVATRRVDRKSTRLNSSHLVISYAVFCLKKQRRLEIARRAPRPRLCACAARACLTPTIVHSFLACPVVPRYRDGRLPWAGVQRIGTGDPPLYSQPAFATPGRCPLAPTGGDMVAGSHSAHPMKVLIVEDDR